jgi:16S rRNA (cytosine1402-N4)-methyltransferase
MPHIPVLKSEVLELLRPERGGIFVDGTLGLGGHTEAMLAQAEAVGKKLRVLGIDQDEEAMAQAKQRLGDKIEYLPGNFGDIAYLVGEAKVGQVDGILLDLGVSSYQIDTPTRGFSFQENGPLDMRMDLGSDLTAALILNTWPEQKLADIFYKFGEERFGRKLASIIVERRKKQDFEDTLDLAELIKSAYPAHLRHKHPHPATRVFQALRIATNYELEVLEQGITSGLSLLAPGGILAIISFHSLEDRIVKHRFREAVAAGGFTILTKKPLEATDEERSTNPRSRSAKLRAIQRDSD